MNFDLPQVDTLSLAENGVDMPIRDGKGAPLVARNGQQVIIRLMGSDSSRYRALTRAALRKRMSAVRGSISDDDLEAADRDTLELLVSCTVSWTNVLDTDGNPVEFTPDNVRGLYLGYPMIRDQAEAWVNNRANFTRASS